jgi:hypothetical protein
MAWSFNSLPANQNYYDYQLLFTTDGVSATATLTNAALLTLLTNPSPLRSVLTGTYANAGAAAEALMRVARVRVFSAAAGSARGFGFSIGVDGDGLIEITIGHDGQLVTTDGILEIEFRHTYVR